MMNNSLEVRMLAYENVPKLTLTKRMPLIIRIDGRAFHTWTRNLSKPFDDILMFALQRSTQRTIREISGAKLAFIFSDEISLLITDYDALDTEAWFNKEVMKLCSVSASLFTAHFNSLWHSEDHDSNGLATFDARCFVIPKEEVCNYFIYRQRDAERNSINALAQSQFSHKSLQGLKRNEVQEKLFSEKSVNWNDLETWKKRGSCVIRTEDGFVIDDNIPIFSQDREYIERFVMLDSE